MLLGATCWNRLNTMLDDVGRKTILGQHFKQMLDVACCIRLNIRLEMLEMLDDVGPSFLIGWWSNMLEPFEHHVAVG